MGCFDEVTLSGIANDFGGSTHVHCSAGTADILTDDEVIQTGTIDEWEAMMAMSKALAKSLDREPAIMLKGIQTIAEIDTIDAACLDNDVELYLYDGMTLTNIAEYWLETSRDKAMQVAKIIADRHGIGARSNDLMKYQKEMFEVLAEMDLGPESYC